MSELRLLPGQRIPGSRHYREYCIGCDTPLRVSGNRVNRPNYCEDCTPRSYQSHLDYLTPRQREKLK